jgi:hypothetical protein
MTTFQSRRVHCLPRCRGAFVAPRDLFAVRRTCRSGDFPPEGSDREPELVAAPGSRPVWSSEGIWPQPRSQAARATAARPLAADRGRLQAGLAPGERAALTPADPKGDPAGFHAHRACVAEPSLEAAGGAVAGGGAASARGGSATPIRSGSRRPRGSGCACHRCAARWPRTWRTGSAGLRRVRCPRGSAGGKRLRSSWRGSGRTARFPAPSRRRPRCRPRCPRRCRRHPCRRHPGPV